GIGQLLRFAPTLRRPLLEQADRIAVAGVEVAQRGLLQCGHEGDADRSVLEVAAAADADDEAGVVDLLLTVLVDRSHLHLPDLRGTDGERGIHDDDRGHSDRHHSCAEPEQGTNEHGPAAPAVSSRLRHEYNDNATNLRVHGTMPRFLSQKGHGAARWRRDGAGGAGMGGVATM